MITKSVSLIWVKISCLLKSFLSLSRLPKTRSFDNLTTACDSSIPPTNRRSSDPSLNEKWQEHRRSLELSSLGNPSDDLLEGENLVRQGRTLVGAELSVAAGVAEGQIMNILQEATKEEGGTEESTRIVMETTDEEEEDVALDKENRTENQDGYSESLYEKTEKDTKTLLDNPVSTQQVVSNGASELQGQLNEHMALCYAVQEPSQVKGLETAFLDNTLDSNYQRTEEDHVSRLSVEAESPRDTHQPSPPLPILHEAGTLNMESSTETLTENGAKPEVTHNCLWLHPLDNSANGLSQAVEREPEREESIELQILGTNVNRTPKSDNIHNPMPSPCALPLAECKEEIVCNGEVEPENKVIEKYTGFNVTPKYSAPNGHCVNGEEGRIKVPLSRQVSTASSSSASLHLRNLHHKGSHAIPGRQPTANSPEQPARSHLDDDGMPVYADVIQQRLRQIESGHQQEVETLKKQVQELRSRLESQYLNSALRFNGDYGDEVVSKVIEPPVLFVANVVESTLLPL